MQGGPVPKPTGLKILEGVRPDRINGAEPKPDPGLPDFPKHLDPVAKAAWFALVPQLQKMGVLTKVDGLALECLVQTYSEMVHANKVVYADKKKPQLVVMGTNGVQQSSAHHKTSRELRVLLLRFMAEFGLTPASRSKIKADPEADVDPLSEYM